MHTIRRRLGILFITCSILAILLITLFVNINVNNKFNEYMVSTQNKRYERIVSYFEELYKREGKWDETSGIELMHEAYMGNYCLTLLASNKKAVWGMNPGEIKSKIHSSAMHVQNQGIYTSKRFEIKVSGNVVGYVDIGQYSSILLSQDDINFKRSINKSIVFSGIIALFITILLGLYFSKQFSNPIKNMSNISVSLSKGNFDIKSTAKSSLKEVEELRKSLNILADKLKNQDMLRRRLVSDISHEIRTPLNVLQNNLEAMIDGIFPVTEEGLNHLNMEVIRFGRLLNDLNLLKDFEAEGCKLNFKRLSLDMLIKEVCENFYIEAEGKNIDFKCDIAKNMNYMVIGDRDKLKQVFINLISNAIKFTREGGKISINLYAAKDIILEIRDTGIGISEEDLPFVFERFYRGDKSRNETPGRGIGLTIAKDILRLHSANIEIESKEGKGTICRVTFNKDKSMDEVIL